MVLLPDIVVILLAISYVPWRKESELLEGFDCAIDALEAKLHLIPEPLKSHYLHKKKMEDAMAEMRSRNFEVFTGGDSETGRDMWYENVDGIESEDVFVPLYDIIEGRFQSDPSNDIDTSANDVPTALPILPPEIKIAGSAIFDQIRTYTERLYLQFVEKTELPQSALRRRSDDFSLTYAFRTTSDTKRQRLIE